MSERSGADSQDDDAGAAVRMPPNDAVVAEFRANGGVVAFARDHGAEMLLLHTTGARTGADRLTPLVWFPVDDQVVLVASYSGRPEHPAWYHNLVANPDASIEVGSETREVRARVASGGERSQLWAAVIARHPGFARYEESAKPREIPVMVLEPR